MVTTTSLNSNIPSQSSNNKATQTYSALEIPAPNQTFHYVTNANNISLTRTTPLQPTSIETNLIVKSNTTQQININENSAFTCNTTNTTQYTIITT